MLFNCPVSSEKVHLLISILELNSTCKVIDIGCGEGELLTLIQQASGADCLGIDIDQSCIQRAEQKVRQYDLGDRLHFLSDDVRKTSLEKNSYDLAVCVGSSHAFGQGEATYVNALKEMNELLKPRGLILVGEGYWKQPPKREYLDFIGEPVGIYNTHEQNIQQAESLGFIPLYATTSSQDEWDHFEWCFRMEAEYKVIADPDNEMAKEKLEKVREWNHNYRKFGRTTMGFGFYLYMTPL
ncbi:SAM-dependent methyltransferase [Arenicella xantha]|uniref:Methyltransferase family protein n=1 Tax=Arenicella xantha TaxID=644221 RepID=A0A395JKL2_9GAMM|nr:class I SAM-dependent methyltransferase [Arenicella xantha]RBP49592.1 methyltransferase family protein [Arenicella xantha]